MRRIRTVAIGLALCVASLMGFAANAAAADPQPGYTQYRGVFYGEMQVSNGYIASAPTYHPGQFNFTSTVTLTPPTRTCTGQLVFQGDGNLVEYRNGVAVFNTGTSGQNDDFVLQMDGNAVLYHIDGQGHYDRALWASNTVNTGAITGEYYLGTNVNGIAYHFNSESTKSTWGVENETGGDRLYEDHQYPAGAHTC